MDFFKSAVASIAKGPAFPYSFGERVDIDQSIWTLHNGTRREDGSKCSIFSFDANANRGRLPLAKNALRKLRTLRHPGVIKVLDTVETDALIYIATERVTPLTWSTKRRALSEDTLKWGLHNVAKTLKFMNDEAASVHGNLRASSIFTSESGEWKVGGLEILSSLKEDDAIIFSQGSLVPDIGRYSPPEVVKNGSWQEIKKHPVHAVDSYQYGILISEVCSGSFSGQEQVGTTKGIPLDMQTQYKRLTHAMPKMRLSVGHFLEQGKRNGAFFDTPLIQLSEGIDNLSMKDQAEKDRFLSELEPLADSDDFPEDFFKVKVLPELLKAIEFGGAGPRSFGLVMRIAGKLSEDEYDAQITPVVVRLFSSPDRALRVCLLDNLPVMIDHLNQKIVTDKIFPQLVTGFGDLAPIVREQTVKAVLVVVPKLSDRIINGELLRHLAKTANDDQPGIRTNTTICLGKIARNLGSGSRSKVLSAAFGRALRDPFVHARNAALMALAATVDLFPEDECATKMLPAICPSLVDKEKMIRDQANKTMNIYLERIRNYSKTLPDTVLPPPGSEPTTRISTPQPGPTGAAGGVGGQLMGWAISSFANKLGASGEIQPNADSVRPTPLERTTSTPTGNGMAPRPTSHPAPSAPVAPQVRAAAPVQATTVDEEDFGADWAEMDDQQEAKATADAWDDAFSAPLPAASRPSTSATNTSPLAKSSTSSSTPYDDGGEPDFEGWLNAQAAAKQGTKRPLPKGLAPKRPATPTTTALRTKQTMPATSKPAAKKPAAPAKEDEDDGWGDAWG